ncbi:MULTISPECIES: hypothetical protein [unclassified Lentimicrobium]|uniref:hypothetical protein n=1 Tax=unclassified Lentimicrobium TaxID=2677434 RepID=UPI0015580898|nr:MULTISPECIES: hypothetical protein [unclassified Lentimicrobium]NPD45215.1 hypothetical protein [Lentimicrobium sp. S6]NPD85394.1 hypothetical protein [Lentimicrobium sp. L6]
MINSFYHRLQLCLLITYVLIGSMAMSQTNDTFANWDNYYQEWNFHVASQDIIDNPDTQGIYPSAQCQQVLTNRDPYDFIYTDFYDASNFDYLFQPSKLLCY